MLKIIEDRKKEQRKGLISHIHTFKGFHLISVHCPLFYMVLPQGVTSKTGAI